MRTLERNKNTLVKYANRIGETTDSYGMPISTYGAVSSIRLSLVPFDNAVEATNYGVNLATSYKVALTADQCALFNGLTRIWINATPNAAKDNHDYTVVIAPLSAINNGTMVLSKRDGK